MASLKADNGKLVLDFTWRGLRCREYLALDDSKDGRAKAKQTKLIIEGEIAEGSLDYAARFPRSKKARTIFAPPPPAAAPDRPPRLDAFAPEWLDLKRPRLSNAHADDLDSLLRTHLIPFFGETRLMDDVKEEDVERFMNALLAKTLGGVRINKARALLSRLCAAAVKRGWLAVNPVLDVKPVREEKAVIDPLSWKEVALLLDKGFAHDPESRRFYQVEIFTGLRTSELIGLQWGDLDLTADPPTASIRRAVTKADGVHPTKTEGSERVIDLRPRALTALKEQKAATRLKSEYIFCNRDGGPLDRDNLMNRVWYPALTRAGLRARKPYQTRHTFATLTLSAGEEIGWVAKQLGHTNTEMVIRHYYRFIKNNTRQDGSAFDKAAAAVGL
jgi:integrase